jgi:hypothetical protein
MGAGQRVVVIQRSRPERRNGEAQIVGLQVGAADLDVRV